MRACTIAALDGLAGYLLEERAEMRRAVAGLRRELLHAQRRFHHLEDRAHGFLDQFLVMATDRVRLRLALVAELGDEIKEQAGEQQAGRGLQPFRRVVLAHDLDDAPRDGVDVVDVADLEELGIVVRFVERLVLEIEVNEGEPDAVFLVCCAS